MMSVRNRRSGRSARGVHHHDGAPGPSRGSGGPVTGLAWGVPCRVVGGLGDAGGWEYGLVCLAWNAWEGWSEGELQGVPGCEVVQLALAADADRREASGRLLTWALCSLMFTVINWSR